MGEKEGLETAMRYFEDRKTKLKQLEYYQVGILPCSPLAAGLAWPGLSGAGARGGGAALAAPPS